MAIANSSATYILSIGSVLLELNEKCATWQLEFYFSFNIWRNICHNNSSWIVLSFGSLYESFFGMYDKQNANYLNYLNNLNFFELSKIIHKLLRNFVNYFGNNLQYYLNFQLTHDFMTARLNERLLPNILTEF